MQKKLLHKNVNAAFLSMLVLCVAAISLATPRFAQGEVYRPPNPVMDYVPQNIGIKDKPYRDFTELDCRECHGENTAVRHHNTEPAMMGKCLYSQGGCHDLGLPGYIVRDCQICHTSNPNVYPEFYAVWGDLGNPHHKTDLANTGQCNQCHDPNLVVEAYSVPPPIYAPGPNTPTPASCENCHFWDDPVNPTIHGTGHIETWGPTGAGMHPLKLALGFDPDNLPSMGTHEEINGMVYSQCALCHWSEPGNQWDTNPYNPLAIRFCENCHTVDQLHNNPEHVNTNNIYTVNGVPNQEVTGSAKCMACHGSAPPTIFLLTPNGGEVIPSGSTYTIQWEAPPEAVKFTLKYSINNGSTWKAIASKVTGTSYNWNVPALLNNKNGCLVKVIGFNSSGTKVGEDISDSTFTMEVVKVTSPDGGETLTSGNIHTITWTTNATKNPVANVKLFRSINGGATWTLIKTLTGNPSSYNWTVPAVTTPKTRCKVKVVLRDSGGVTVGSDISDAFFTIQP